MPVTPVLGELGLSQPKAQNDASGPGARVRHQRLGITSVCATIVTNLSTAGAHLIKQLIISGSAPGDVPPAVSPQLPITYFGCLSYHPDLPPFIPY